MSVKLFLEKLPWGSVYLEDVSIFGIDQMYVSFMSFSSDCPVTAFSGSVSLVTGRFCQI